MTKSHFFLSAGAVAVLAAVIAASTTAQAPAGGAPPPPPRSFPAPTNLKVLPKTLTGAQVREIMEGWEASLGGNCATCHTADPKNLGPNGRPRLNFADDTKQEKQIARMMFKMTEDINGNYVSMIKENSGVVVTCGTCHRGHVTPEPFVAPKEDHEHHGGPGHDDHDHPAAPGK